jgi:uncharacterized membrane protein
MTEPQTEGNDKILAALSYPIPIIGIVILVSEQMKAKPFLKFHAVQSIAFNIVIWVVYGIISLTGIGALCFPLFWLATLWPAWYAYQGQMYELPWLTNFLRGQHWI